jgi:N-acetylmuramoyl-L-alanine amidase
MRPAVRQYTSPNFRKFPQKRKITCVVIHATATKALASPLEWLTIPASHVSAHYLIDVDGTIIQLVDENNVAWHSGESVWKGKAHVNEFSIGIELVNANDGIMPYADLQVEACRALVAAICRERKIKSEDVVGHRDIAPGRKTDPLGFPFDDFRGRLYKDGIA